MVLPDRKLKLLQIADTLKISEGTVFTILHEHLSMRKLCLKWVPRLLIVNQKQQHVDDLERFLELFQRNKKDFYAVRDNRWNMDSSLHSRVKSAVSWVDNKGWKSSKADKNANVS